MVNINLVIIDNELQNNSSAIFNKLHCIINTNNEKTIDLYSNINYNFIINSDYYFTVFENFQCYSSSFINNSITYTYLYGKNNIIYNSSSNTITSSLNFKLIDKTKNYTWSIFKKNVTDKKYEKFLSGILLIHDPLIYIKLKYDGSKLIQDITHSTYNISKDYIEIDNNIEFSTNKVNIILYENYNYIFELEYLETLMFFDIYLNNINNYNKLNLKYEKNVDKLTELYIKNIPNIKKNKFLWQITNNTDIIHNGNIIFKNVNKNASNDEILYDYKFKNIDINYKLIYNSFLYKEHLNIIKLNNITNYLLPEQSHKLFIINNINKNISIILPSKNIYLGLTYKIIFNIDLISLNILCEDNNETLDNYDKIKGSFFISNQNNLFCKTVLSNTEMLDSNNIETNLSQNIILKQIKLNNGNNYNGGLFKYGFINIICSEYLNNKYIWNIEGELIGNSINYSNSYLYNPFI